MGRKLAPEEQSLFVKQLLIVEIVRLMGLAESIEAGVSDLFDTRGNLLVGEGVTIA